MWDFAEVALMVEHLTFTDLPTDNGLGYNGRTRSSEAKYTRVIRGLQVRLLSSALKIF